MGSGMAMTVQEKEGEGRRRRTGGRVGVGNGCALGRRTRKFGTKWLSAAKHAS